MTLLGSYEVQKMALEELKSAVAEWKKPQEMAILKRIHTIKEEMESELKTAESELEKLQRLTLFQSAELMNESKTACPDEYETRRELFDKVFDEKVRSRGLIKLIEGRIDCLVEHYLADYKFYGMCNLGLILAFVIFVISFCSWWFFDLKLYRGESAFGLFIFSAMVLFCSITIFIKRVNMSRYYSELSWWNQSLIQANYKIALRHPGNFRGVAIVTKYDSRGENLSLSGGPFSSPSQFY
ncbi:MAG: hypothetical protein KGZ69_12465 [Methylomonas sp.]|nr:hypothetical protein [Methylomonas sp.]